jgi:hypothetical protein
MKLQPITKLIEQYENKPELEGFSRKQGYVYMIKDISHLGHYKIGFSDNPDQRLSSLNTSSSSKSLEIYKKMYTFDKEFAEKIKNGGEVNNFAEAIKLIDEHYTYFAVQQIR